MPNDRNTTAAYAIAHPAGKIIAPKLWNKLRNEEHPMCAHCGEDLGVVTLPSEMLCLACAEHLLSNPEES